MRKIKNKVDKHNAPLENRGGDRGLYNTTVELWSNKNGRDKESESARGIDRQGAKLPEPCPDHNWKALHVYSEIAATMH